MMIAIASDTHLDVTELHAAALLAEQADLILHAGDEVSDAKWLASQVATPVLGVAGNWDRPSDTFPIERIVEATIPVYLTHGHRLRVKESPDHVADRARKLGANIAIYGHTHILDAQVIDDVLVLNPGSLSQPRGRFPATFATLELDLHGREVTCRVRHLTTTGRCVHELVYQTEK